MLVSVHQVRLDVWHYMRRISSCCTTESHPLYAQFMRQLSGCIFQWSQEEVDHARGGDGGRQGDGLDWSHVNDHQPDHTDVMVSNS